MRVSCAENVWLTWEKGKRNEMNVFFVMCV